MDIVRFLINRAVIARQGPSTAVATRLAIPATILDVSLPESVVISTVLGRNQAPPPSPAAPAGVVVPDLVGKPLDEARDALDNLGLRVAVEQTTEGQPATVVATDPKAGVSVPPGSRVVVIVGALPKQR